MGTQNLDEIYVEYSKQVYKYLFCLTHNYALSEELMQETFYIALKNIKQYRGECKLYVWLCQIAKHLWYKELKRTRKIDEVDIEEMQLISYENFENNSVRKLDLMQKIKKLDERTQEIIFLKITGELTFKEIGEILGISETLARVTFYRGKQKIIKEVDDYAKK
jgi:RNA polymerase sigma factor (sigma-70 family)